MTLEEATRLATTQNPEVRALAASVGVWLTKFLSLKFWYPIAQTSYSAYLIQPVIIFMAIRGWYHGQAITFGSIMFIWALCALATFCISIVLYAFIEKPLMDLRPK